MLLYHLTLQSYYDRMPHMPISIVESARNARQAALEVYKNNSRPASPKQLGLEAFLNGGALTKQEDGEISIFYPRPELKDGDKEEVYDPTGRLVKVSRGKGHLSTYHYAEKDGFLLQEDHRNKDHASYCVTYEYGEDSHGRRTLLRQTKQPIEVDYNSLERIPTVLEPTEITLYQAET